MEPIVSSTPHLPPCHPPEGEPDYPYFFSTDGGKIAPRFLQGLKPSPVVRSDVTADIKDFVNNLRRKWPQQCFSIFTDPTVTTGFDPRWFFDEYDDHVLGREFLFNVICTIIKENEDELFRFVREWSSANANKYDHFPYILWQGVDFVFDPQDRVFRGEEFLRRALEIMRQAYEKACIDANAQDFFTPVTRATSNSRPSNLSHVSTAESNPSVVQNSDTRNQHAFANVDRSTSGGSAAHRWTPSLRVKNPNATPVIGGTYPHFNNMPVPGTAQARPWGTSPSMNNAFHGQVPPMGSNGPFSFGMPPYPPFGHSNAPGPIQLHPCNIPRIPAHELSNNMPPFTYDSGTLPFPGVPILQHPQDTGNTSGSCSLPPMALFQAQYQQSLHPHPPAPTAPPPQPLTVSAVSHNEPWVNREDSTRPFNNGDRGRRDSTMRGRGRGGASHRGRRVSSGQGSNNGSAPWSKENNQNNGLATSAPLISPASTSGHQLSGVLKNAPPGYHLETPPSNIESVGHGVRRVSMPVPVTAFKGLQGHRYSDTVRGTCFHGFPSNAGPAPRDASGNIDTSKALGPHYVGENVEDLFQLFIGGVLNMDFEQVKAIFEPAVVVADVKFMRDRVNAFVEFHSTADVKKVLEQTQDGKLSGKDKRYYVEVPRYRQHQEFLCAAPPRWRGRRPSDTLPSNEHQENANDSKKTDIPMPSNVAGNRTPPQRKSKGKTQQANVVYSPQDARSQYPPIAGMEGSSTHHDSQVQPSHTAPEEESSYQAGVAQIKGNSSFDSSEENKQQPQGQLVKNTSATQALDNNVLRQVQNHPSQVLGQRTAASKANQSASLNCHSTPHGLHAADAETTQPMTRQVAVQDSSHQPSSKNRRDISKPIFPALPLKSPSSAKDVSPSEDSSGSKCVTPRETKATNSEGRQSVSGSQFDGHAFESKPKVSPKAGEIGTSSVDEQQVNIHDLTVAGGKRHKGNDNDKEPTSCAVKTDGNVNNSQNLKTFPRTKKWKDKRKKNRSGNPSLKTSTTEAIMPQACVEGNPTGEAENGSACQSSDQIPVTPTFCPTTSAAKEESAPNALKRPASIEASNIVIPPDLDQSWKVQYDKIMSELLSVDHRYQDDVTKEIVDLKQEIKGKEEKIVAGDNKMSTLTASSKKSWKKKRRQLLEEYNESINDKLPILMAQLYETKKVSTPPSDVTNMVSPTISSAGRRTPVSESHCSRSASQADIGREDAKQERDAEHTRQSMSVRSSSLPPSREIQHSGRTASKAHDDRYRRTCENIWHIDELLKGNSYEEESLPSIRQLMESGQHSAVESVPGGYLMAFDIPKKPGEHMEGLGISGLEGANEPGETKTESMRNTSAVCLSQYTNEPTTSLSAPQEKSTLKDEPQGMLRGGANGRTMEPGSNQEAAPAVSPSSKAPRNLSYASVAKMSTSAIAGPKLPASNDPAWSSKAKHVDHDASSPGSGDPTPTSGTTITASRRTSNAAKGKEKIGDGEDWAVKQGEQVWGDQGFQQC